MEKETDRSALGASLFADLMKMTIRNFLKMIKPKKRSKKFGCLVIDIRLKVKANFYMVEITHCGIWTEKGLANLFDEFLDLVRKGILPERSVLAYVFKRADGEENETVDEIRYGETLESEKITKMAKFIHFPSFKNYISIKLQYRLLSPDLDKFKEILIAEFQKLKKSNPEVKITFYLGDEVFYSNNVSSDDDFQDCQLLTSSLIAVVKQSMNNHFKERCLQTLSVDNVHHAEKDSTRKLFSMIHENYTIP